MTLEDHIAARIRAEGPISMADYMADCLMHPTLGYYSTRDPFGVGGDFVTAPEISQMFGELVGLTLAQAWMDQGSPKPFTLAELGPGRGTLMRDMVRAAGRVPGFAEAAQIVLVETSHALREVQKETLAGLHPEWTDQTSHLPDRPLFIVANEFFDALPVRQFERGENGWAERRITLSDEKISVALSAETAIPALAHRIDDTKLGQVVELCPAAAPILQDIANRISTYGGAALIIDYGDGRSLGDTLQAVRAHEYVPILDQPGESDLTAHVDFEALAEAAASRGCAYTRLAPQGVFLERLGITARARSLAAAAGANSDDIAAAHRRLTHPDEMGKLFKVMGVYPKGESAPPGLEP